MWLRFVHLWRSESFWSKIRRRETHDGDRTGTHICMAGERDWSRKLGSFWVQCGEAMAVIMICGKQRLGFDFLSQRERERFEEVAEWTDPICKS